VTVKRRKQLKRYRELSLMLAMFFLPFGYDFLFKLIMEATGSYWAADLIFYGISGSFWLSYILLSRRLGKRNTSSTYTDSVAL
jgi:threonine/homoserine efflux transporter RhtA